MFCGAFTRPAEKIVYFIIDTHIHPQCSLFHSQSYVNTAIYLYHRMIYNILTFLSLYHSTHRQATSHHSSRPIQSDTWGGQCGTVEVPGIRRPHSLHQLAEGWGQSTGKGPPHVPPGAGQPADQKH